MRNEYGRVSTSDQDKDVRRDALAAAGCNEVFIDKDLGHDRRPELDKTLRRPTESATSW